MKSLFTLLLIYTNFSWAQEAAAPPAIIQNETSKVDVVKIVGQVLEKGTRKPLREISVFILPHKIKAFTDEAGRFSFEEVPAGAFAIVINQSGYERLEMDDAQAMGTPNLDRKIYLERVSYSGFETTIVSQKKKMDGSKKSLTIDQVMNLPGAGRDPVKAVQNLPGVNRVAGFSSQVVIQGSAPKDTVYDMDGHEIPLVFHFGGLNSVLMPEALESVDYYSAGYGPYYSRALGGVVSLQTRNSVVDDRPPKKYFFVDTLKAGGFYEAKLTETSHIMIGARLSYFGLFVGKALEDNEAFNLTVAPEFGDFSTIYSKKLSEVDKFKLAFLMSKDSLGFLLKEPMNEDPSIRGKFSNETNFFRLIPQWEHQADENTNYEFSAGFGQDYIKFDFDDNYFKLVSKVLTVRGAWQEVWSETYKTELGFDNEYRISEIATKLPQFSNEGGVQNPIGVSEVVERDIEGKLSNIGLYLKNEVQVDSLEVKPNLRLDRYNLTGESIVNPRLEFRKKQEGDLVWKAALGQYSQPPEPQEVDEGFGNPNVKSPRAIHYAAGFEKDFRAGASRGWQWNAGLFDRHFDKLVVNSSDTLLRDGEIVPENYNNSGKGRAFGFESLLKFDSEDWSGWLSYTWARSTRWSDDRPEYLFEYDQTHNINVIASKEYSNNWKAGIRIRYVTGNPYTPIVGSSYDSDNDVYIPKRGSIYSRRLSDFSQVDFRVDKKIILDEEIWTFYLDIQNLLSQKNPERIQYSYDYSSKEDISGLPILPTFGVQGEF